MDRMVGFRQAAGYFYVWSDDRAFRQPGRLFKRATGINAISVCNRMFLFNHEDHEKYGSYKTKSDEGSPDGICLALDSDCSGNWLGS